MQSFPEPKLLAEGAGGAVLGGLQMQRFLELLPKGYGALFCLGRGTGEEITAKLAEEAGPGDLLLRGHPRMVDVFYCWLSSGTGFSTRVHY